jgi:ABC-2 type transport system permease protein
MSTAAHVAARPAVALPSTARLSLNRTGLELKSFFRRREAVVFTFSLPVVLLIIFGSIFHGTVGVTGVSYRLYFTAGIIASGIMSTTFVNLGISIVLEREDGTLKRLAGTPCPRAPISRARRCPRWSSRRSRSPSCSASASRSTGSSCLTAARAG